MLPVCKSVSVSYLIHEYHASNSQQDLGDTKTFPQIAETFEQVYGRKPTLKNLGSLDELNQKMHEQFKKDPEDLTWMPL